jgi:ribosomal protein S27E
MAAMAEVRCPDCETVLVEPRRGNGRLAAGVDVRRHETRPDVLKARCPGCGKVWELRNVRVVLFLARPAA